MPQAANFIAKMTLGFLTGIISIMTCSPAHCSGSTPSTTPDGSSSNLVSTAKGLAETIDGYEGLPTACYLVYKTETLAARHCPAGAGVVQAHDFWQQDAIGWSCDCSSVVRRSKE